MSENNQNDNFDDFHNLSFDEKKEIEKLQETIRKMTNFTDDSEGFLSQSPRDLMGASSFENLSAYVQENEFDPYAAIEKPVQRKKTVKTKKYVIMLNPENIDYFERVPISERSDLINKLLVDYRENKVEREKNDKLIKFSKHFFVGLMTVLISLPVMFIIIKKSIQLTINNYKDVQSSFEKLYEARAEKNVNDVRRINY